MRRSEVERVAQLLNNGYSIDEVVEQMQVDRMDSLSAGTEDDGDDNSVGWHCISQDDRFDSRGEALLPRLNEAGEPNW